MNAHSRLAALAQDFPAWQIQRVSLHPTWLAVLHDGTFTHVIASHNLDELRGKLANANVGSESKVSATFSSQVPSCTLRRLSGVGL